MTKTRTGAAVLAALAMLAGAAQAQQGVSKTEIVVGSIQDLSGPIAGFGKQVRLGMMLRVDEINEQGGIAGRKIKLLVEDSAYDPKKAVLAAQKLVNQDKIFIMAGHIGGMTSGTSPRFSSMTTRMPDLSDSSRKSEMPSIFLSRTSSPIRISKLALLT